MELKKAIEVLKMNRPLIGRIGDEAMEAIDTVVRELEKPTYTAEDMEAFAEWVDNHYTVEGITGKQLREMWEKERKEEQK